MSEMPESGAAEGVGPGPLFFDLAKPVPAHGKEVTRLTFREPTGGDIMQVGNPVVIDMAFDPPKVTHDERKMRAMLSRLAAVPPSTIDRLAPADWVGCAWLISPFFVPNMGMI